MPHKKQAKHLTVQNQLLDSKHPKWGHLVHLLQISLMDTMSLLQAWKKTGQAETLHQARMAWRRQKSLLKFYKPLLPELPQQSKSALQDLWHITGQLRNLDVALQSTLPAWRHDHPQVGPTEWPALLHRLHRDHLQTRQALAQELADDQVTAGFQELTIWTQHLATVPLKFKRKPFEKWAKQRLHCLQRKIRTQRHPFTPEGQHQSRLLLKQKRHALESLLTIQPRKKLQTQLNRVRKKQATWGHAQDMQVALNLIEGSGLCPELTQARRTSK